MQLNLCQMFRYKTSYAELLITLNVFPTKDPGVIQVIFAIWISFSFPNT